MEEGMARDVPFTRQTLTNCSSPLKIREVSPLAINGPRANKGINASPVSGAGALSLNLLPME